jgi:hypothetical protein
VVISFSQTAVSLFNSNMAFIDIANFKYGLDLRRSELTSVPGTLMTLNNAHINQGGQIEKRKGFVRTALTNGAGYYFGLQATDAGLLTFGSAADPGGWPRGPVTGYQRLQHPAVGIFGVTPAAGHVMTSILQSTAYNGKALALATFADGFTFLFYDGTAVMNSYTGLFLTGFNAPDAAGTTVNQLVRDLVNGFNSIPNWVAGRNSYNSFTTPPGVRVPSVTNTDVGITLSPAAVTFNMDVTIPANGSFGFSNEGSVPAYAGVNPTTTFTIAGGAGVTYLVQLPIGVNNVNGQTPDVYYQISTAWNTFGSNNATAAGIATLINAGTDKHGFTATSLAAVVTVTAPLTSDPSAFFNGTNHIQFFFNDPLIVVSAGDPTANGQRTGF